MSSFCSPHRCGLAKAKYGESHASHVEWQHNDGKYYSKGVMLPKDKDFSDLRVKRNIRFKNDSTIIIEVFGNPGYNRKFDIDISVQGEQGIESISHSERITIYQEGRMGKGDFEVKTKNELVEDNNEP